MSGWRAMTLAFASGLLLVVLCVFVVLPTELGDHSRQPPGGTPEHGGCASPGRGLPPLRGAVPFDVQLKVVDVQDQLPKLQSFARAADPASGRWLLVAGRTGGLHGFDPNNSFPTAQQNHHFHVIDPRQGFKSWKLSVSDLLPVELADALQATNSQHLQDGRRLIVVGGYGYSRVRKEFITHDLLISIDIPLAVRAVVRQNASLLPTAIRFVREPRLQLSGGGLQKISDWYILVLGAYFEGAYPAPNSITEYSQALKMFQLIDDPVGGLQVTRFQQVNATGDQVQQWHRRDLHVLPSVYPGGRQFGVTVYGGVFTPQNSLPFLHPIEITLLGESELQATTNYGYQQKFSQYECATILTYDNDSGNYMATFLGGMGLSYVNPCNEIVQDIFTPFVNVVSTLTRFADGTMTERVHSAAALPKLLGANAAFMPSPDIPLLAGSVIDLSRLGAAFQNGQPTLIGHMYGGLVAEKPNFGSTDASSLVIGLYLQKLPS